MLLEPGQRRRPCPKALEPSSFSAEGLVVTGTMPFGRRRAQFPTVVDRPAGETGDGACHMTGYGGFGQATTALIQLSSAKLWLERGGT